MVDILYVIVRCLLNSSARCGTKRKESAETMRILLVHGIGRSDIDPNYYHPWEQAIRTGLTKAGLATGPEYEEFHYDDAFEKHDRGAQVYAAAAIELIGTAAVHAVTDPISNFLHGIFHPGTRYLSGIGDYVRWRAGMVAQFVVEDGLRKELRDKLSDALEQHCVDMVAAHSLGSLLTFDFLNNDQRARHHTDITFGSPINNPFVRARLWPGRLIKRTSETLRSLRYDQKPQMLGPANVLRSRVPGGGQSTPQRKKADVR